MNIFRYILIPSIIAILLSSIAYSQQTLRRLTIEPPSRAYLHFTNYPIKFSSQLADDKRKVIIDVANSLVADTARNRQGSDDISEIYVQFEGKNIKTFISLKEAKGYTAVPLPYSRSVMIDVFNWEKLTPAEDSYRTALLALEDDIISTAKTELLVAARGGIDEAAFFMGLILISEGKINSALKNLEFAEFKQVNIPDLYAALSQLYFIKKDEDKRIKFANKFMELSGVNSVNFLSIPLIIEQDTAITEPIAHLVFKQEASFSNANLDTAINERFSNLFSDSVQKSNQDIIPGIYNDVLTLIGGGALVVVLLIILLYLRWRNKQILLNKNFESSSKDKTTKKSKPKQSPNSAKKTTTPVDSKDSIEAKKLLVNKAYGTTTNKTDSQKVVFDKSIDKAEDKSNTASYKKMEENKKAIESMLQTIRSSKDIENQAESVTKLTEIKDEKPKNVSAKIEIAMHLAEEQRRIKQKSIESLDNEITFEQEKLAEVAKKLGIEKGSLETKKAISNIEKDAKALEKLKDKFKPRTDS